MLLGCTRQITHTGSLSKILLRVLRHWLPKPRAALFGRRLSGAIHPRGLSVLGAYGLIYRILILPVDDRVLLDMFFRNNFFESFTLAKHWKDIVLVAAAAAIAMLANEYVRDRRDSHTERRYETRPQSSSRLPSAPLVTFALLTNLLSAYV